MTRSCAFSAACAYARDGRWNRRPPSDARRGRGRPARRSRRRRRDFSLRTSGASSSSREASNVVDASRRPRARGARLQGHREGFARASFRAFSEAGRGTARAAREDAVRLELLLDRAKELLLLRRDLAVGARERQVAHGLGVEHRGGVRAGAAVRFCEWAAQGRLAAPRAGRRRSKKRVRGEEDAIELQSWSSLLKGSPRGGAPPRGGVSSRRLHVWAMRAIPRLRGVFHPAPLFCTRFFLPVGPRPVRRQSARSR